MLNFLNKNTFNRHEFTDSIISKLFKLTPKDPLSVAFYYHGIGKYKNDLISGEKYFIDTILPTLIEDNENATIFDIGANIGDYSKMVQKKFTKAQVYAFEPNIYTYSKQKENLKSSLIRTFNIGLGEVNEDTYIYSYQNNTDSQLASLLENVMKDIHNSSEELIKIPIKIVTLDDFCLKNRIEKIDFLKIDTEGYELFVLKGAKELLMSDKINVIQFEFNEMNVISRVFLKDFYDILGNKYDFFRLDTKKLIPLGKYNSKNEIFQFQNIICLRKS